MQLDWLIEQLTDLANVDQRPQMEGRTMSAIVGPKPIVLQRLASDRAKREADPAAQAAHQAAQANAEQEAHDDDIDDDDEDDEDEDEADEDADEE
jgi:translation initiation factor IF-3